MELTGHYRSKRGQRSICRQRRSPVFLQTMITNKERTTRMMFSSRGIGMDRTAGTNGTLRRASLAQGKLKNKGRALPIALLALMFFAPAMAGAQTAKYPPTIVFMTDFGVVDDSVAICRGVMYSVMPEVRIVDLSHQVTPFSILDGARFLDGAAPYYPAGTVFVVVIDPTVGSTRKAIVAKSKRGQYFVLPDNGLLTLVEQRDGIEAVREITNPDWMIGTRMSSTFHGRDIFSPVGAHMARGDDWTTAGPVVDVAKLVRLDIHTAMVDDAGLHGEVIGTDGPFGNIVLNVPAETFAQLGYRLGDTVPVRLAGKEMK